MHQMGPDEDLTQSPLRRLLLDLVGLESGDGVFSM